MKIFNVMMCRDLGGLQQVFLDYSKSLNLHGHKVINVTSSNAIINKSLGNAIKLPNLFSWCLISKLYFWLLTFLYKPDIIICHGGRAINFATALRSGMPAVGVTHGYNFKRLKKCNYLITITKSLKGSMIENGYPKERIFLLPNMVDIDVPYAKPKNFMNPVIIGALGRFVSNKGFQHLMLAIKILINQKKDVALILAGAGEEENNLRNQAVELGITDKITFIGWVHDKKDFFDKIDVFCCPSEHEPFGMVILEAMKYSKPIVATESEGALEILHHKHDALLAKNKSPEDIAKQISYLIEHSDIAKTITKNAYAKLVNKYHITSLGSKLSKIMQNIIKQF